MPEMKEYPPGTFCWVDLGTTDAEAAKEFYGEVFGWEFDDRPVGEGVIYTMIQHKGKDVAALWEMPEEMTSQGIPTHWLSYVSVTSADEIVRLATELGAEIPQEPFDVYDVGRMAVLRDPTGAVLALWQPKDHMGAALVNEPGCFCWNELGTKDVGKASEFYTRLFGWGTKTQKSGEMEYTSLMNGDSPAGGMYALPDELSHVPSTWLVYFAVDDCDKAAKKIESLGGDVVSPPKDIPGVGRFAVAQDPQGGHFAFIKLENPA
ncbi:MAG: VOC family protein [Candidatus Latescibacterota bacterium]|nr:MAG: VOC family protein [Candidatus Latescibacterota bacterium]